MIDNMTDKINERLSELMDGEFGDHSEQIIDDLVKEPSLQKVWARYHLISDSLKQNLPQAIHINLAENVSKAISCEPAIFKPGKISIQTIVKPVVGFAIAASVAAMAILSLQQNGDDQAETALPQIAKQVTVPAASDSQYVFPASADRVETRQVKPVQQTGSNSRMNSYLVNYNEYRTTHTSMQGLIPYVRVIAHENNE